MGIMYPTYNTSADWSNLYDFCIDWDVSALDVWNMGGYINVGIKPSPYKSNKAVYLPFYIQFGNEFKTIELCKIL